MYINPIAEERNSAQASEPISLFAFLWKKGVKEKKSKKMGQYWEEGSQVGEKRKKSVHFKKKKEKKEIRKKEIYSFQEGNHQEEINSYQEEGKEIRMRGKRKSLSSS